MHMKQHAGRSMRIMEPHIDRKGIEMDYKSGWSCKPVWLQSLKKCLQIELLLGGKLSNQEESRKLQIALARTA
ncbi:hypothetical protein [uncultured Sphaerochaeta sp.]|uniref:hypothetical protein n=1 Tax=uncultured Sphaerochaeta sp. TaxID=886478 RepID=UPI0029C9F3AA|nr:hypothetical protein [uncultured Sphaerochaeta sp.]